MSAIWSEFKDWLQNCSSSFSQQRPVWHDLIVAFKIFTRLLDVDQNLFFSLPLVAGLEDALSRYSKIKPLSEERVDLFVEFWNKLSASVETRPNPLFCLCGFFRPVVAYFQQLQIIFIVLVFQQAVWGNLHTVGKNWRDF